MEKIYVNDDTWAHLLANIISQGTDILDAAEQLHNIGIYPRNN